MSNQRKQYRSVPLRAQAQMAPERHTTGSHVAFSANQSHVSHRYLPAMLDEDGLYRLAPSQRSARRYTDAQGRPVIEQGKRRLVMHQGQPPRRFHWVFFMGIGMLLTLLLWLGGQWAMTGIQAHTLDAHYGYPRIWQTDAVVGHDDSARHPSHFLFENLHGQVIVIEIPGGNPAHARIYSGPTLFEPNADQLPVTGSFVDVNRDGRPDMEIHIDGQTIIYLNNGTQFVPPAR
jgi:hypothetical protein